MFLNSYSDIPTRYALPEPKQHPSTKLRKFPNIHKTIKTVKFLPKILINWLNNEPHKRRYNVISPFHSNEHISIQCTHYDYMFDNYADCISWLDWIYCAGYVSGWYCCSTEINEYGVYVKEMSAVLGRFKSQIC